jgi:hypothetical protein
MNDPYYDRRVIETANDKSPVSRFDFGGTGGNDGGMESRVKKLEDDMIGLKVDIGVIKQTMATKQDVADMGTKLASLEASLIKWMIGFIGLATTIGYGLARVVAH